MVSLGCCSATACAYAGIAQLVEQLIRNQQVVSSSLISSSKSPGKLVVFRDFCYFIGLFWAGGVFLTHC